MSASLTIRRKGESVGYFNYDRPFSDCSSSSFSLSNLDKEVIQSELKEEVVDVLCLALFADIKNGGGVYKYICTLRDIGESYNKLVMDRMRELAATYPKALKVDFVKTGNSGNINADFGVGIIQTYRAWKPKNMLYNLPSSIEHYTINPPSTDGGGYTTGRRYTPLATYIYSGSSYL